jgi:Secretion system C-terminal sorting domain/Pregnancy-associated plasma protein-A
LPVVFHIIHTGGVGNISDDQVLDALDRLNLDFSGQHPNQPSTDSRIRFSLAKTDPDGNCTNGITRTEVAYSNASIYDSYVTFPSYNIPVWSVRNYINIWVFECIDNECTANFGTGGFASYPSPNNVHAGVVIKNSALGTIGTAQGNQIPDALAHEMGHSFSLFHPWFDDPYNCDQDCHLFWGQGLTHGDRVDDTGQCRSPTTPIFNNLQFPCPDITNTVSNCTDQFCPDFDVVVPYPSDNFMSYTFNCQYRFTDGQICRMQQSLLYFYSNLVASGICQGGPGPKPTHYIVDSNETWDLTLHPTGSVTIQGSVTIKRGATLTIAPNISVRFCGGGHLLVEKGAHLRLYGTLTNQCGNRWYGIQVHGDPANSQSPIQGRVTTYRGSVIENAITAISLYGPNYTQSGGIVQCTGTTFKNNRLSVEFSPYQFSSKSSFHSCNFVIDDRYRNDVPFLGFAMVFGISNVHFSGCSFDNQFALNLNNNITFSNVNNFGFGISCLDCGLEVNSDCQGGPFPCTDPVSSSFTGLGFGIRVDGNSANRSLKVTEAQFDLCYYGIYTNFQSSSEIYSNTFRLGRVPKIGILSGNEQFGTFHENPSNFLSYQENTFLRYAPSTKIIGTYVKNLGDSESNRLRRNTYDWIRNGQVLDGLNRGVNENLGAKSICNTFTRLTSTIPTGISVNASAIVSNQFDGSPLNQQPTGNSFSGSTPFFTIANLNPDPIEYHFFDQIPERPQPNQGIWTLVPEVEPNPCNLEICIRNCDPNEDNLAQLTQSYYLNDAQRQTILNNFTTVQDTNALHLLKLQYGSIQAEIEEIVLKAQALLLSDSINDQTDSVLAWTDRLQNTNSEVTLAKYYTQKSKYGLAQQLLSELRQKLVANSKIVTDLGQWSSVLNFIGDRSIYELTDSQLTGIEAMVHTDYPLTSGIIRSILAFYGKQLPIIYTVDGAESQERSLFESPKSMMQTRVNVNPNPATNSVKISTNPESLIAHSGLRLAISNKFGQLIQIINFGQNENEIIVDISDLSIGTYFFSVSSDKECIGSGKFVKF